MAMALRLRVRDQAALRAQFPGQSAEDIAGALLGRLLATEIRTGQPDDQLAL